MINDKEKGENDFKNHKKYTTIMSNKYNTDLIELSCNFSNFVKLLILVSKTPQNPLS